MKETHNDKNTMKTIAVFKIGKARLEGEKAIDKDNDWFDMIRLCQDAYFKKYATGHTMIHTFWRGDTLYGLAFSGENLGPMGAYRDKPYAAAEDDLNNPELPEILKKFLDNTFSIPDDPAAREVYLTFAHLLGDERRHSFALREKLINLLGGKL